MPCDFILIVEWTIASVQNDDIFTSNDEVDFGKTIAELSAKAGKIRTENPEVNNYAEKCISVTITKNLVDQLKYFPSATLRQKHILMSRDSIKRKSIQQWLWLKIVMGLQNI